MMILIPQYRTSRKANRPIVTLIYDEQFTADKSAPIPSNTAFAASHVGQTKCYNHSASDSISGGKFNYATPGSSNAMVIDAAAARSRLQGRVHYCKHATAVGATDFQSFLPIALVGESPASNWWALMEGQPGIIFKGGAAGFGDVRNLTPPTQGNYQWKSAVTQNGIYEWAIVERITGSMSLVRVDSGDWKVIWFEKSTTQSGKIHARQTSCGAVPTIDRLCTANTSWYPAPLVQHSFAAATTPSDGDGQPESEGGGIAGTSVGSVTISGSALQMSADGEGFVYFDAGQADVGICADLTVYDTSRAGIVFRVVDASNYLAVVVEPSTNTIKIIEVVAGVETTLASQDSNLTPDFYNLASGSAIYLTVFVDGNDIRAGYAPGALHLTHTSVASSRHAGATGVGCLVAKGAAASSAAAANLCAFALVQNVPEMEAYP